MWRWFSFLVISIFLTAACSDSTQGAIRKARYYQTNVTWQFDSHRLKSDEMDTQIYLIVNGRRVFLLRAGSQFSVLDRQDYESHAVPSSAVTACAGWWAGQGQDLYVIRRKRQLVVFIRYLDEQAPIGAYKRLKVIALRR
jgi:hypothetical protein